MDRRHFLKAGSLAIAATATCGTAAAANHQNTQDSQLRLRPSETKSPNLQGAPADAEPLPHPAAWSSETGGATDADLHVRFLGTGAADWNGPDSRGEHRRLTSVLLDGRILIDFTATDADMLPKGMSAEAVFYTHSHEDHYNAEAELTHIGAPVVYVSETWVQRAEEGFAKAAAKTGSDSPKVVPLKTGQKVTLGDIAITALPANHSTADAEEQTLIYLIEKRDVRLLYATDTGGIVSRAARLAGIDAHTKGAPISGLIMEATMGIDYDEDFRIFTHSSVGLVKRTADVLLTTGRLMPPSGQPVYLTHMARTLHGTQADLDACLPMPLRAAYDGLEVVFRAGEVTSSSNL